MLASADLFATLAAQKLLTKGSALSSVIKVAFGIAWDTPIIICDDGERRLTIRGPREALRYLQNDFPMRSGEAYWSALAACNRALINPAHVER